MVKSYLTYFRPQHSHKQAYITTGCSVRSVSLAKLLPGSTLQPGSHQMRKYNFHLGCMVEHNTAKTMSNPNKSFSPYPVVKSYFSKTSSTFCHLDEIIPFISRGASLVLRIFQRQYLQTRQKYWENDTSRLFKKIYWALKTSLINKPHLEIRDFFSHFKKKKHH